MAKMTKTKNVPVVSLGTRHIYQRGTCNIEIGQCPYTISRLVRNFRIPRLHKRITQSRDWLRNFRIPRVRSAISRLRKFLNCAEHIYSCRSLSPPTYPRYMWRCLVQGLRWSWPKSGSHKATSLRQLLSCRSFRSVNRIDCGVCNMCTL